MADNTLAASFKIRDLSGNQAIYKSVSATNNQNSYFSSVNGEVQATTANASGVYDGSGNLLTTTGNFSTSVGQALVVASSTTIGTANVPTLSAPQFVSTAASNLYTAPLAVSGTNEYTYVSSIYKPFDSSNLDWAFVQLATSTVVGLLKLIMLDKGGAQYPINVRVQNQDGTFRVGMSSLSAYESSVGFILNTGNTWVPAERASPLSAFPIQKDTAGENTVGTVTWGAAGKFYQNVAISRDGRVAIIMAATTVATNTIAYYYRTSGTGWTYVASPVGLPSTASVGLGSVAINGDGTIVAICDYAGTATGSGTRIKVYTNTGTVAVPNFSASTTITDPSNTSTSSTASYGRSMSMSDDGLALAFGDPLATVGTTTGNAWVYRNNAGTWTADTGVTFSGTVTWTPVNTTGAGFGHAVALNSDATQLTVSVPFETVGGNAYAGQVMNYSYNGTTWNLNNIRFPTSVPADSYFGYSLSMNKLGDVCAIGTPGYNSRNGAIYLQYGGQALSNTPVTYTAPATGTNIGFSVALNSTAGTMMVGAPGIAAAASPYFPSPGASYVSTTPAASNKGDVVVYIGSNGSFSEVTTHQSNYTPVTAPILAPGNATTQKFEGTNVALSGLGDCGLYMDALFANGANHLVWSGVN